MTKLENRPEADPGGEGAMVPPGPVKISHKKMAAKGGCIDFMFLGPPYPATGSATVDNHHIYGLVRTEFLPAACSFYCKITSFEGGLN